MNKPLNIVILGGGTAGWMTAAALAKTTSHLTQSITLIESDKIGTIGVGEATIPHIRYFNSKLGINEHDFIKATNATYKLGIEFINWGKQGDSYIHPFGEFGVENNGIPFHHYWRRGLDYGLDTPLFEYSLPVTASRNGRFEYPDTHRKSIYSSYSYAFHLDANKYAEYLKNYSVPLGVKHIEGKVERVEKGVNGDISSLILEDGTGIQGDLFIDCSGFRSLLLNQELGVKFEDWSQWLMCDRAVAIPSRSKKTPPPFTQAIAHSAGWQWKIPLQNRYGNGHVYSSAHISDDEAAATLLNNIEGEALSEPNFLRFRARRYHQTWKNNCVAIGLSAGFLEPLESTSIYLIQSAIMKLVTYLPNCEDYSDLRLEYNRQMKNEYERLRDFLILHYHATEREDSEFWKHCKHMQIPEGLKDKLLAFKELGYIDQYEHGLFLSPSWVAVLIGQGVIPSNYHPKAGEIPKEELLRNLSNLKKATENAAASLPLHKQSLEKHLSGDPAWPSAAMSLYGVFS